MRLGALFIDPIRGSGGDLFRQLDERIQKLLEWPPQRCHDERFGGGQVEESVSSDGRNEPYLGSPAGLFFMLRGMGRWPGLSVHEECFQLE